MSTPNLFLLESCKKIFSSVLIYGKDLVKSIVNSYPNWAKKRFKVQDLLPVFLIVHDHLMKARCYTFKDSISLTHFSSVSHFTYTSQKIKSLSLRDSSVNVTKSATFFEKILNGKLYILCSDGCQSFDLPLIYFQIK